MWRGGRYEDGGRVCWLSVLTKSRRMTRQPSFSHVQGIKQNKLMVFFLIYSLVVA